MARILLTQIDVHYGFVRIGPKSSWDPSAPGTTAGQENGLIGAALPHVLAIITGIHSGQVRFVVTWHDLAPPLDPEDEEIVEISWTVPDETLTIGAFEEFHDVAMPPGPSRARFRARGMDAGHELDTSVGSLAPDSYALDLWAAPWAPEEIIRQTSELAAYSHAHASDESP
ncbi:hypothetical protein [Aeromicrobium alkaliterrae]|uniref:Uncharacterized protein n=1 Tax=Aeromicrobium alkaliterrae TaxID=302168 RepID=A0ABP4VLH2_9ACTN